MSTSPGPRPRSGLRTPPAPRDASAGPGDPAPAAVAGCRAETAGAARASAAAHTGAGTVASLGLGLSFDTFSFGLAEGGGVLGFRPPDDDPVRRWRFMELEPAPGVLAAVAVGADDGEEPVLVLRHGFPRARSVPHARAVPGAARGWVRQHHRRCPGTATTATADGHRGAAPGAAPRRAVVGGRPPNAQCLTSTLA
ncbi:hypothetical protein ACFY2H_35750 [Streptomyces griseofuscus]|uniref:hypothetical protein n=1 Tax=Streptomyces griseofuscus TaxID=146922 RepID=UPI00368669EF